MEGGDVQMKKVEDQQLISECFSTTPNHSLVHHHKSFKETQDRHVHRRPWNCRPICSSVRSKNRLCRDIWLVFVYVHTRSYVCIRHENVSGSFETQSCFRNVYTLHELTYVRKVVTGSLTRFLLVDDTCRHVRRKRHGVIWTCVCTQGPIPVFHERPIPDVDTLKI